MIKRRTSPTLWARTTRVLGKLLDGMVSSDERRDRSRTWNDYPIFPPF
jgi:hypothetical protein